MWKCWPNSWWNPESCSDPFLDLPIKFLTPLIHNLTKIYPFYFFQTLFYKNNRLKYMRVFISIFCLLKVHLRVICESVGQTPDETRNHVRTHSLIYQSIFWHHWSKNWQILFHFFLSDPIYKSNRLKYIRVLFSIFSGKNFAVLMF